uniref:Uncharacterized protein n=1 Tax=Arundo donax TaxID=35708 RepID=A0A0A9QUP8_ARUDO
MFVFALANYGGGITLTVRQHLQR